MKGKDDKIDKKQQKADNSDENFFAADLTIHGPGAVTAQDDKKETFEIGGEIHNSDLPTNDSEAQMFASRYATLFDFAPVGLVILDNYGLIKNANISFCDLLNYKNEEISNRRFQALIHPDCQESYFFFKKQVALTKEKQHVELQLLKKDGGLLHVILETKILPGKVNEGESITAIIDITEKKNAAKALLKAQKNLEEKVKQRTQQLEDANISLLQATEEKLKDAEKMVRLYEQLVESEQKLKEQNENKDKFFALLSHDLRTPFYGIMGFAKLLSNKIDSLSKEEIKMYASNIFTLSQNFDKLMTDLLVWCNVQMNNVAFEPDSVSICKVIEETAKIFQENAKEKEIDISWTCEMGQQVRADENMLKSIFRNLISNALKFTKEGGKVLIESKLSNQFCTVSVTDNGVGISEKTREKIFKINEHTGSTGTANEKGTGLGLILCKEFIEKHGGSIWFESEPGKGTTFHFTLPRFNEQE